MDETHCGMGAVPSREPPGDPSSEPAHTLWLEARDPFDPEPRPQPFHSASHELKATLGTRAAWPALFQETAYEASCTLQGAHCGAVNGSLPHTRTLVLLGNPRPLTRKSPKEGERGVLKKRVLRLGPDPSPPPQRDTVRKYLSVDLPWPGHHRSSSGFRYMFLLCAE